MDRIIVTTVGIDRDKMSVRDQADLWELERRIEQLRYRGIVVTVELVPHRPRRMGAYDTLIDVRRARKLAEPTTYTPPHHPI